SFAITTAAAFGLGMVQSVLLEVQTDASWLPATGVGKALPLLLIVIAAMTRGALMPPRGQLVERRLPVVAAAPRSVLPAVIAGALAIEALLFQSPTLTGGFAGTPVRAPSLAGHGLGPGRGGSGYPQAGFALLVLAVTVLAALGVWQLRGSRLGRRMLATRADE